MRTAEDIVRQEVHYCISYLVSTLAAGNGLPRAAGIEDLSELCSQAAELASPIDDYEEAAIQAGWDHVSDGWTSLEPDARGVEYFDTAQELCETLGIEPYAREVFEHWIVSDWLADRLAEKGEKVDKDFAGVTVWARTTTGQGIASDSVIEAIAADINRA